MQAPPSGTLAFLLTDIEGSTRLWDKWPTAMQTAIECHDSLMRAAIESHGGFVFKTMGDAFYAAFTLPSQALAAAKEAQTALLHAFRPPHKIALRVRMALYTGTAELRNGDYFGPGVNRVSRLLNLGYGGQILVGETTRELTKDSLPISTTLRDLGVHQLRDVRDSERIYQVIHSSLPAVFPPLRSVNNFPTNLPHQLSTFIGRESIVERVMQLLAGSRLLTLMGPGGCGKTRLALQVATASLNQFPGGGVWFIEFAPVTDPDQIDVTLAAAIRLPLSAESPPRAQIRDYLRERQTLLVLDNCEHLEAGVAGLADEILRSCVNVRILATSRWKLRLSGETTYRVPSLSVPDHRRAVTTRTLLQSEAGRLFVERAREASSDFEVTSRNAASIALICRRLDGIPLAIELAAARIPALPVEEVAARLDDWFRLLRGGPRDRAPRQQTLEATIDWSYSLLGVPERIFLNRLSVFQGGWDLFAAETVCHGGQIDRLDVVDILAQLVDRSLVLFEERSGRYRLLETIRQYAERELARSGEHLSLRDTLCSWALDLAEEAEPHLQAADQEIWLRKLEIELPNLRVALKWSVDGSTRLRIASALQWFWAIRNHVQEGQSWLEGTLSRVGEGDERTRAKASNGLGILALKQSDYPQANEWFKQTLDQWTRIGDQHRVASALNNLGITAFRLGDYETARDHYTHGMAIYRKLGDMTRVAILLLNTAGIAKEQSDFAEARRLYDEVLDLQKQIGDTGSIAMTYHNLADMDLEDGDLLSAKNHLQECIGLRRELGDEQGVADALLTLAVVELARGENRRAAKCFGGAEETFRRFGGTASPAAPKDYAGLMEQVRRELGEAEFRAAWQEGAVEVAGVDGEELADKQV